MSAPPAIPPGQPYTPYWCEENIYLLAHAFQGAQDVVDAWDVFVVFISNESKTVALWNQRAASAEGRPIVWDYHVILVLRPRSNPAAVSASSADTDRRISWIYDFDTTLTPVPLPAEDYILNTFSEVPLQFQALLKVVPGPIFLDEFSSDRSHMIETSPRGTGESEHDSEVVYNSPPPSYPPIHGPKALARGANNNLMTDFVSMSEGNMGQILNIDGFVDWCRD